MTMTKQNPGVPQVTSSTGMALADRIEQGLTSDEDGHFSPPLYEIEWRAIAAALRRPKTPEINHFERTSEGVIDWKMEAERANRLLAQAEACRPATPGGKQQRDAMALTASIQKAIADFYPAWEPRPDMAHFIASRILDAAQAPTPGGDIRAALELMLHVRGTSEDTPEVAAQARAALAPAVDTGEPVLKAARKESQQ